MPLRKGAQQEVKATNPCHRYANAAGRESEVTEPGVGGLGRRRESSLEEMPDFKVSFLKSKDPAEGKRAGLQATAQTDQVLPTYDDPMEQSARKAQPRKP